MDIFDRIKEELKDNSITSEQCKRVISLVFSRKINTDDTITLPYLIKLSYEKKNRNYLPRVNKIRRKK